MIDALIFFTLLGLWSAVIAYAILFRLMPLARQTTHAPAAHAPVAHAPVHQTENELAEHGAPMTIPTAAPRHEAPVQSKRQFSAYEGFRSFAEGAELTVEDIVKGLSRR